MFTQCTHCKAVFRVNMREITVAKGQLRCGECHTIFSTKSNLSTTPPKAYEEDGEIELFGEEPFSKEYKSVQPSIKGVEEKPAPLKGHFQLFTSLFLALLLIAQLLYNNRHLITGEPRHLPEKIQMLNHNAFTHPNESGVLLISASIENTADSPQHYPILEVKLTNSESQIVALRRFSPEEYLESYTSDMLLPEKQATNLKLKIKDPGSKATRFQFSFY